MAERKIPAQRQQDIYHLAESRGTVSVGELSTFLGVSEITIRRDLSALERRGMVERTHGGAICTHRVRFETLYAQKGLELRREKQAIGHAAAELIEEGDTVLVNSGSTTLEVIRHLSRKHVRVITNNVAAVLEAQALGIELILIGGEYRPQSNSVVGGLASDALNRIYGSKAVIGIDGFSVKHGLTTPVYHEAEINRLMIERTRGPVIVVADHRKLAVVSNFVTANVEDVDILVTDEGFQEEYRSDLESSGIRIVIARKHRTEDSG